MEKNMQPQVKTEEDKLVPIDTSGDSMDIEIKDDDEKIEEGTDENNEQEEVKKEEVLHKKLNLKEIKR
jgi:hypothetical protein